MTLSIVYYDELGCVTRHTTGMPPDNSGMWLENTEPQVDPLSCYVKNGKLIPMGSPPSLNHAFDYSSKGWVDPRTLDTQWPVVRRQRDALLAQSDWTQLPDVPLATKETWAIYRQALRDVTLQPDPFSVVWPVAPG